jgi:succinyl-CoA synthetase beta subunit
MDIEEVAHSDPDAIKVHTIDIRKGFSEADA